MSVSSTFFFSNLRGAQIDFLFAFLLVNSIKLVPMIAMEQEGSTDGFLKKKFIPFVTCFELVSTLIFTLLGSNSPLK